MKKKPSALSSVILWSVISAAFIGPGTVTTSIAAGADFGLTLLWSVTFATFGCYAVQEISARISIASGLTLGESFIKKFGPGRGPAIAWTIGIIVVLGCAAYQAGNIMGAVAGLNLVTGLSNITLTIIVTLVAGVVLWSGGSNWISNIMMILVVIMSIAFAALAFAQDFSYVELVKDSIVPTIPAGSELIVLSMIGTTIVPYNVFIGAGITKGQTIPLMRIGLAVSVALGGFITAAILVAAISIKNFSSFQEIANAMAQQVGPWGEYALGLGLFAAGFASATTSPYASSLIATTVFHIKSKWKVRVIWISVLLTGFIFGISPVQPIPVILFVQALNGLILPLITMYLIIIVNDDEIVPRKQQHDSRYNIVLLVILLVVLVIGLNNVDLTISKTLHLNGEGHPLWVIALTLVVMIYPGWVLYRKYR
ncbi:MAG: divalent metal cation transporter [Bacteroidota bacterium]